VKFQEVLCPRTSRQGQFRQSITFIALQKTKRNNEGPLKGVLEDNAQLKFLPLFKKRKGKLNFKINFPRSISVGS